MSVSELIKKRVTITKFNNKPVDSKLVISLLDDAVYAPNHKMREPWRFIILEGEYRQELITRYITKIRNDQKSEMIDLMTKVFSAPMVLAVITPIQKDIRDELEDMQAAAAMIENFLLLATEIGLSTAWKTPKYIESDLFKDVLGIKIDEIVLALIMIGYSDIEGKLKIRKRAEDLTTFYK
jgi:nitroreductase